MSEWWEGVKTWFNENIAHKFTKQYWKDKFDSLVSGAKEKLDELKQKFTDWKATLKTPHMNWDMDGLKATGVVQKALEALNLPIPSMKSNTSARRIGAESAQTAGFALHIAP